MSDRLYWLTVGAALLILAIGVVNSAAGFS